MAQLGAFDTDEYGPDASWWKMHHGHTRSWPYEENDWTRMELPSSRPSPRHHRRWDEIPRHAHSAYSAAPSSVATSRQRPAVTRAASVLLSSPLGMRHHSSDTPLIGRPSAAPSFLRASTAPSAKAAAAFPYYNQQQPRSDLPRAASHRDPSPRSAAHYSRFTPDSRRSMRSSLSDSDGDTELTRPTPVEDDEDDGYNEGYEDDEDEVEYNIAARGTAASIYVDKQALRDRMSIHKHQPQNHALPPSKQKQQQKQKQKQKQKQQQKQRRNRQDRFRGLNLEEDDLDEEDEEEEQEDEEESSVILQGHTPSKSSHHRQRSRRSSVSRGDGAGNNNRGRKQESAIPEEAVEEVFEEAVEEPQADADTEMEDDYDDDRRRRRATSRHTRRSVSRHTATTPDRRRDMSRSKSRLRRADSDEFNPRASSRRPTKRYCESEVPDQNASGPTNLRRAQTHSTAPSHVTSHPSIDSLKRPSSLFEAPLGFGAHAFPTEKPSKRNCCHECGEDIPSSRLAKLDCGHRMCSSCLKNKYRASMNDERLMPPRCCTRDAIAPKFAEKLFDPNFKQDWNYRFRETSLGRRIYCPSPRCGQWIKPEHKSQDENARPMAVCNRCHTKVCCLCNGKFHGSRECPRHDDRLARHLDNVRGSQNCYKCKSPVELENGRNHMICRCGAESCMICGSKWGHCECPIFDLDTDYPVYSQAQHPQASRFDRIGSAPSIPTRDYRTSNGGSGRPYSAGETTRARPKSYEDNTRLRTHRDEYRADGYRSDAYRDDDHDLARQMDAFGGLGESGDDAIDAHSAIRRERMDRFARRHANDDDMGMRARRRRSFMEEHDDGDDDDDNNRTYPSRAATDILPSVPQPPPAPPTPPQQQAQSQLGQRYQHRQASPAHSQHLDHYRQLPPQHMQQEQHPRQVPPASQYPEPSYAYEHERSTAPATADFYATGLSRTRAVHTDSLVGRLADRFNTETRSSPMHRSTAPAALPGPPMPMGVAPGPGGGGMGGVPLGPLSASGPMSLMPPPSMMQAAQPPMAPAPMMGGIPMMPIGPMMQDMPMMRRLEMDEDPFMAQQAALRHGRSSEQIPFPDISHGAHYEDPDDEIYGSGGGRTSSGRRRRHAQEVPQSEMAGLAGLGRGMDRVYGWREFVSDEPPAQDSVSTLED